jgi:hypothetical protein
MSSRSESTRTSLETTLAIVTAAVLALSAASPSFAEESVCGDVNGSGDVTSSDALSVLRKAVDQPVDIFCGLPNRIGEPDDYNQSPIIPQDHLLGQLVQVERESLLTHFGFIARHFGSAVRFALYTHDNGSPGTLVAETALTEVLLGVQEVPVVMEETLAPGFYWIMANFTDTQEVAGRLSAGGHVIKFKQFSSAAENTAAFGEAQQFTGQKLNYWLKVEN